MKQVKTVVDELRSEGYRVQYRNTKYGKRIISIRGNGIDEEFLKSTTSGNNLGRALIGDYMSEKQQASTYKNFVKMKNRKLRNHLKGKVPDQIINAATTSNNALAAYNVGVAKKFDYDGLYDEKFVKDMMKAHEKIPVVDSHGIPTGEFKQVPTKELVGKIKTTTNAKLGFADRNDVEWLISRVRVSLQEYSDMLIMQGIENPAQDPTVRALEDLLDYLESHKDHIIGKLYTMIRNLLYEIEQMRNNYSYNGMYDPLEDPNYRKELVNIYTGVDGAIKTFIRENDNILREVLKNVW